MAALRRALAAGLALAATAAQPASVITYVETAPVLCPTPRCDALGYPVPLPVASQTPVAGFRRYDALQARLADLALASDALVEREAGRSLRDRPIRAFVLGDADPLTPAGFAEPAVLVNGGIHAREWASPEVVAGLVERVVARATDSGLHRYLVEHLTLVTVPVLNVDGFLQTQRFPDTALTTEFSGDGSDWPRDGRMRRKNMRDVDEVLSTQGDYLFGVDNNRNNAPFFDSGNQNSDDARSLVYHGASAGSEPENQALYAAAGFGPRARLRLFVDVHSFSRIFFAARTGNARHDALQESLQATMTRPTGGRYPYSATAPNVGIGSTDEHFAYGDQIPAYTLEVEPRTSSRIEYGIGPGGVTHDGFILPESQIARVRAELADALVAGAYRMAGPPAVAAVHLRERAGGAVKFDAQWARSSATTRALAVTTRQALQPGTEYTLWVAFDKPMRVRDGGGAVAQYPGHAIALAPQVALEGVDMAGAAFRVELAATAAAWRATAGGAPAGYRRYADDAFAVDFTVPAGTPVIGARRLNLALDVTDFTGQALDADPRSAADLVDGGWARYENTTGNATTDAGGTDRSLRLVDDGSPLFGAPPGAVTPPGGGGGAPGLALLAALLLGAGVRRGRLLRLPRS